MSGAGRGRESAVNTVADMKLRRRTVGGWDENRFAGFC